MSKFDFNAAAASDWLILLACQVEILVTLDYWSSSFPSSPFAISVSKMAETLVTIGCYSSSFLLQH
jgi:hypothetical protein